MVILNSGFEDRRFFLNYYRKVRKGENAFCDVGIIGKNQEKARCFKLPGGKTQRCDSLTMLQTIGDVGWEVLLNLGWQVELAVNA